MATQTIGKKIISKVAEKIPLKYFVPVMGGIGIGASVMYCIAKSASNQYDDLPATEITGYADIINCTDEIPKVPEGTYNETPANVDNKIQPDSFTKEICLNRHGNESIEEIGKLGGIELELSVDHGNETVDITKITEVPHMPSSYNEEPLHLHDSLSLNSTNGHTYKINLTDFGKNGEAMLEITNLETGKSVTKFVENGYTEALKFGNETLELSVNKLFSGGGNYGKFLEVSAKTY
ncbi:MAG: hypothetical protein KAI53_01500 [Candidatus Aenigmarchaeota archaeon]|nr:hypothetical protein [Candidatus Aenigmarchaeota archaeon]